MLSQTSIHAIKALTHLAARNETKPIGSAQLASEIDAPANYLGKTLKLLTLAGLLQSQRGLGGGLKLAKSPESISLFDIVEPIEHVSQKTHCFMGKICCGPQPCSLHPRWARLHGDFIGFLKEVTLKDLVKEYQIRPALNQFLKDEMR